MPNSRCGERYEHTAANGLLHRRALLTAGAFLGVAPAALAADPLAPATWTRPGAALSPYGERAPSEASIVRAVHMTGLPGMGVSLTPIEALEGTITPSSLHFERHHNGVPAIDPSAHRLMIHGLVNKPLLFDLERLSRYPTVSRIQFLECSGNSLRMIAPTPAQATAGELHGLLSCSEWTGVPLAALLEEAGVRPEARWLVAEGADGGALNRSIPLAKAMDDALLALHQNGERLRPEQGFPMRLFLPGWEGSANVKWLRRIELTASPAMSREETSKYTDLRADGRADQFTFAMGVKSVITSPSGRQGLKERGLYQISGVAWSGAGRIRRVEVSADGGRTWADAELAGVVLPKSLTRFRVPWLWSGAPALLQSRATDETGAIQPTRTAWLAERSPNYYYHFNGIQTWQVDEAGQVRNTYA